MDKVIIRKAAPEDAKDFSHLVLYTAPSFLPALYGPNVSELMEKLFRHKNNYFGYEHSFFLEVNGENAGMTLVYGYDDKMRERISFGLLLLRYMGWQFIARYPLFMQVEHALGKVAKGEFYSSNSAIYPKFRGKGLGEKLFGVVETAAKERGYKKVVVDVDQNNTPALKLREKLGYKIIEKLPVLNIDGYIYQALKLVKEI